VNERSARAIAERTSTSLPPAEADAYLREPVTDEERAGVLEQVRWFTRRYPTPLERLAYITRASARWRRQAPPRP
jgi:hypothetical protein